MVAVPSPVSAAAMWSMLRCAASMSSTSAGVRSSPRRRPMSAPYWSRTCSLAWSSFSIMPPGQRALGSGPETPDHPDRLPPGAHAQGQAGRPGERLAPADRLAAEVTLGLPVARGDDRDREAAVGDLDLVG